jgi:HrpA-like RNA helicase
MLHYPLDPTHARILLASFDLACPFSIINILSLLNSGGTIFIDRQSEREASVKARAKFVHRDGDHLTGLNVFNAFIALKEQGQGGGNGGLLKWCRENFVNARTMSSALKVRDQLRELVERQGKEWRTGEEGGEGGMDSVVKSLLQGSFMNTAIIQPDGSYKQTAGNMVSHCHLHQ